MLILLAKPVEMGKSIRIDSNRSTSPYRTDNYLLSPVRVMSVVCNVRAPYSGGSNFRQYFCGIRYLGHPVSSTENVTEIVPGEPLQHKRVSQV